MKKLKSMFFYAIILFLAVCTIWENIMELRYENTTNANFGSAIEESDRHSDYENTSNIGSRAGTPGSRPIVGIGLGEDYCETAMEAVQNAGGMASLVKKGQVVLIKPDVTTPAEPGSPSITDYRIVQKIADMLTELGAAQVIVAEGANRGKGFVEEALQISKYGSLTGVELVNLNNVSKLDCYAIDASERSVRRTLYVPKIYIDADVVISIAKLRTHSEGVVALSLNNAVGILPEKAYSSVQYQQEVLNFGLNDVIINMNLVRKPDLAIIEGIVGGEDLSADENAPVKSNIVLASKDLVALDTVALTFMGFKLNEVPHVELAAKNNLGISDLSKINIIGADINSIRMDFRSAFKK